MRSRWLSPLVVLTTVLTLIGLGSAVSVAAGRSDGVPARDGVARGPVSRTVVPTTDGRLRGTSTTNYDQFLGVPYAAPPVGDLRWTAPRPAARWSGVRDARSFGDRCVQGSGWDPGYEQPVTTEDCLYLNVYVPHNVSPRSNVLVWIHGGGFTGGAGQDTDPRKYIDGTGSIFVTVNYRLGAMGFLNAPGLGAGAGNFGLLDQQAALRWVQRNISNFGGDPGKVTIAGQSAGGSSVCDQLSSPTARGLFARAIIVSGGCSMTATDAAQTAGQAFAAQLGCDDVACLRSKPAADIFAAQQKVPVRPAVGGAAFPLDPAEAVRTGRFTRVPVITGQVHDERTLTVFTNYDYAGKPVTAAAFESYVRSTYGDDAERVLREYPLSDYDSPAQALGTLQSDAATYGRLVTQENLARFTPTYAYEFDEVDTPHFYSIHRLQQQGEPARSFPFGATHVDDLGYYFTYLGHTLPYSDDEMALSDQMIAFWSHFQISGTPNGAGTPTWPRLQPGGAWMLLSACDTAESGDRPPAACSRAGRGYRQDHHVGFWAGVLA